MTTNHPSDSVWLTERHRLRRRRWLWLVGILLALFVWNTIAHEFMKILHPVWIGTLLNWLGIAIGGVVLTVLNMHSFEQRFEIMAKLDDERREADLRAQKLDMVRAAGRGLAHQMNQPITVALGYAQLLELSSDAQTRADALQVRESLEQIAVLVHRFQVLSYVETVPYADGRPMLVIPEHDSADSHLYS